MGATAVLEIAAAIPPAKKSLAKEMAVSFIIGCSWRGVTSRGLPRSAAGLTCGMPADSKWPNEKLRRDF